VEQEMTDQAWSGAPGAQAKRSGSEGGKQQDAANDLEYNAASGVNPLVWAASRLINIIPQIHGMIQLNEPERLRNKLVEEVRNFEERAKSVGVSREELIGARYCLCTVIDEAAAQTPWGGRGVWVKYSLLVLFHNETEGGEKYYQLLARLAQNPEQHKNLIELMYYCNALGFEGRFKVAENGYSQLEILKRRIVTILDKVKGGYEKRLSSHWAGVDSVEPTWSLVPPWVVAALCGLIGVGCYVWFLFSLGERSDITYAQLAAQEIPMPTVPVSAPPPPPPPPPPTRLRQFLEPEIREKLLEVRDEADRSVVTLTGDGLFDSGRTEVRPGYLPVLKRIAVALAEVNGEVAVTGYTDNVPMRSMRFPSNWELSRARAEAVRDLLASEPALGARDIRFVGRGEAEPLKPNSTPEGRAKNRRVEITVMLSADSIRRQLNSGSGEQ
jgi:type VI secretion system protein ImpK